MPRPWRLIERAGTPEGALELHQRGEKDFMLSIAGRVLMTSQIRKSELAVAELGCAPIRDRAGPKVLIGGLGLGFTLRAALDSLPADAEVEVAELNGVVVDWCKGPCASLTDDALADPRVRVYVGDVTDRIRRAAKSPPEAKYDAIILDLYLGPVKGNDPALDALYGKAILAKTRDALKAGGMYAVWGEERHAPFEARMRQAGFETEFVAHAGGVTGGFTHAIYLGRR